MRVLIMLTILICILVSCKNSNTPNKSKTFTAFNFSYNNVFSTCFSIKFTKGDTIFVRQHFAPAFSNSLKSNQSYYAIFADIDRSRLDSILSKTNFATYDTSYYQSYEDGEYYQFFIDKDSTRKMIYVHSDSIPVELKSLENYIIDLKKNLTFFSIDTIINFESLRYFLPPSVPAPAIKFTPPKME